MPIYLMTPRNLDAPDWDLSTVKVPVQIEATNAQDARVRATTHFAIAAEVERFRAVRLNPWSSSQYVIVDLVRDADPAIRLIKINDVP